MKVNIFNEAYGTKGGGPKAYCDTIARELKEKDVDIVFNELRDRSDITHFNFYGPRAFLKLKLTSKPTIGSTHYTEEEFGETFGGGAFVSSAMWKFVKYMYRNMDALISPSHYTKSLIRRYGIRRPTAVITNGIEPQKFKRDMSARERFRERFNIGDDILIYSVGYCIPRKGIFTMLRLARRLKEYRFAWVGRFFKGGKDEVRIRKAIERAPRNFLHTGFVESITEAHSGGDIFLFASHAENQGIVILEAAATGNPVIVRDLPVYDGWLKNGWNCIKCRNLGEFEEAVRNVAEDENLRKRLVRNGRKLAEEHDIRKNIKYLIKAYECTINGELDEVDHISSYRTLKY
ncbi:MAG: hypothetical protein DRP11_01725 [Candidatus Aenigmatarchaeota archaeon]|nr:MAG: hypothetical protein DRP11_01725 [Candidatus Aenigmarchaeota archaeon]